MRVEGGLEMLKLSMSNCLINFGGEYVQYGKRKRSSKKSAVNRRIRPSLASRPGGLLHTYWKELNQYGKKHVYFKMYCGDGCALAKNTTVRKLQKWFNHFKREVDWVTKGIIKFTMEIWKRSDEKKKENK